MDLESTIIMLVLIPLIVWIVNLFILGSKLNNASISAISAVILYIFILVSVAYIENTLNTELAAFDLNSDGVFSGNEITPEQKEAMFRVISDNARSFAPFTGAILAAVHFFITWFLLLAFTWVGIKVAKKNT